MLAMSAIAAAKRTDDLVEMGDAWNRMRASALGVLLAAIVIGLSAVGALAFGVSSRSYLGVAMGEAVLLIALGGAGAFPGVSVGPLRRGRTFGAGRLRQAPHA